MSDDRNPADVIYEILMGACDGTPIEIDAFSEAIDRLDKESSEEGGASASDIIKGILEQIDAVLYASPIDGCIKLVRVGGGS